MKQRILGLLKTKISSIGIGGMSFSDVYGKTSTLETHTLLSKALEFEISHIDTSDIYGLGISEERIGTFLKNNPNAKKKFAKIRKLIIGN